MKSEKKIKDILPSTGIWSVEDFADYLGMRPAWIQQKLSDMGIKVMVFSRNYRNKLFRLEDLKTPQNVKD